jgi:hypothetical protein
MPFITESELREMPPAAQQIYVDLMRRSAEHTNQAYAGPSEQGYLAPYAGLRIAAIPEEINRAHANIREGGKEYAELNTAQNRMNQATQPFHENYQAYMNPYQQAVLQQLSEEGTRNFNENIMPALDARFVRLGQFGSTKHANLGLRAARDFQKELLSRQQQALHSGYEKASDIYNTQQNRNIESSAQQANISNAKQAARMADASALENIGRYRQQQEQSILDTQYQEYLRQMEEPMRRLNEQAAILHGIPNFSSSVTSFRETPSTAPTSAPSNIGNIASSLLAARLMGGRQQ